jgi:PAS domain S-box-containing protein
VLEGAGAYFQSIIEASPNCIRVLSVDGRLEFINQRGLDLLEIDDFSVHQGQPWAERWPPEAAPAITAALAEAASGRLASFRAECPTAKGTRKVWDTTVSPVFGEDQTVVRLLATSRDITRELETQAFLDTVVQLLPSPLLVKDAGTGRYVLINQAAEDVFGLTADDALGKNAFDLFAPEEAQLFAEEDADVIASGEMRISEEEPITTLTRGLRYFTTKKLATYDDAGARHIVTLGEDVTDQRAAALSMREALAEAEQASQAKSVFLANMSHEIRTPLNGIIAGADMLSQSALSPRERELVEIIRASGSSLEHVLSDILDLARIESGQLAVEAHDFDAGDLVRSVAALSRLRADEKGVALTVELAGDLDGAVTGDPVRLRQVLTNLLSNAVKFTDRGAVTLLAERTPEGLARFTVRDTGVGFDAASKERVFARFQQADSSITRRFGGTGLGLTISQQLVALMGGALDCESVVGEGSAFWFEIPLPPAARLAEAVYEATVPQRPLRILLADDHPTNRKVVEMMLAGLAEVVSVENGLIAVDAHAAERFDLILMDMQMPVMDGLTALTEIRRREAASGEAHTPAIMLTANALPEHVTASRQAGADHHLAKPITAASLFAAIDAALSDEAEAA